MNINIKNDSDTGESIYVFKFNDETDFDNFKINVQHLTENISSKGAAKNLNKAMNELFDRVSFEKPGSDVLRAEASDIAFMRMFASLFSSSLWNRKVSADTEERLRSEKDEYRSKLSAVKHELGDRVRSLEKENELSDKKLADSEARIKKLNDAVKSLNAALKKAQNDNAVLKNELHSAEEESRALNEKFRKQEEARMRKAKETADEGGVTLDFDSSAVDLEDIPDMAEQGDSSAVFSPKGKSLEEIAAHNAKVSRGDDFARQMAIDLEAREKAATVSLDDGPEDGEEKTSESEAAVSESTAVSESEAPKEEAGKADAAVNDLFADIDESMFEDDEEESVSTADEEKDYDEGGKKKKGLLEKMFG